MIKVGAICDNIALGGQEMGCIGLLRALDRSRFSPHLYSFRAGSLLPEAQALGIPIVIGAPELAVGEGAHSESAAGFGPPESGVFRERFRNQLIRHLREDGIDVALLYAASSAGQWPVEPWSLADGLAAAREANLAAIIERTDGVVVANDPRDNSTFDKVICESKTIRNMILAQRPVLGYRRDQLVVIPNGVDLRRFDPNRYDRAQCREALQLESGDFVIGDHRSAGPGEESGPFASRDRNCCQDCGALGTPSQSGNRRARSRLRGATQSASRAARNRRARSVLRTALRRPGAAPRI